MFSFVLLFNLGCNGQQGGSFFEDPPDCYYDTLFGCGTFDISGNSSYYGYANTRMANFSSDRARNLLAENYSGNWKGQLSRKASNCNFDTPAKINGSYQVNQKKERISMKVPISARQSISLRGKLSSKGLQATGTGFISLCNYSAKAKFDSNSSRKGQLDVQLRVQCIFQDACDLRYSGSVVR